MKISVVVLVAVVALVHGRPEPPVPSYSTTQQDAFAPPPAASYGAPSGAHGAHSGPSSAYGAPAAPSSSYGVPSNTYGAPSSTYGAPSSTYGAPNAISNVYGAPGLGSSSRSSFKSSFGSSRQFGSGKSRLGSGLSRSYVPSQTSAIFKPSSAYGAPSSTYGVPSAAYGVPGIGGYAYDKNQDDLSEPAMYQFAYNVLDDYSGSDFGHREGREGEAAWGSYEVLLPDGRKQIVEYEADETGFRPTIRYEQTGYPGSKNAGGPY